MTDASATAPDAAMIHERDLADLSGVESRKIRHLAEQGILPPIDDSRLPLEPALRALFRYLQRDENNTTKQPKPPKALQIESQTAKMTDAAAQTGGTPKADAPAAFALPPLQPLPKVGQIESLPTTARSDRPRKDAFACRTWARSRPGRGAG